MTHPAAPKLEAIAAGDDAGAVSAHLEACAACAAYVAKLREDAAAFRRKVEPAAFAEEIRIRAAVPVREPARRTPARIAWVLGPVLAAAAALLLVVRVRPPAADRSPLAPLAPTAVVEAPGEIAHFKGGLSVAVIRERSGRQERLMGPFEVEPADRIRLEVAVDREEPLTAGLLASDGRWVLLLSPTSLPPGTHYSDLAARFDDAPEDAVLLVGSPDDVARARSTRNFEGVVAWRVRSPPKR